MDSKHIVKLVVGIDNLQDFYDLQQTQIFDYHGHKATACWTRYKPRTAEDILKNEGSIYRVIKNRIQCRFKILGFEMVETQSHGTRCMIVQDAQMIRTISTPKRPFQGWRYLKDAETPKDIGPYDPDQSEEIPEELEKDLRAAGLL